MYNSSLILESILVAISFFLLIERVGYVFFEQVVQANSRQDHGRSRYMHISDDHMHYIRPIIDYVHTLVEAAEEERSEVLEEMLKVQCDLSCFRETGGKSVDLQNVQRPVIQRGPVSVRA